MTDLQRLFSSNLVAGDLEIELDSLYWNIMLIFVTLTAKKSWYFLHQEKLISEDINRFQIKGEIESDYQFKNGFISNHVAREKSFKTFKKWEHLRFAINCCEKNRTISTRQHWNFGKFALIVSHAKLFIYKRSIELTAKLQGALEAYSVGVQYGYLFSSN